MINIKQTLTNWQALFGTIILIFLLSCQNKQVCDYKTYLKNDFDSKKQVIKGNCISGDVLPELKIPDIIDSIFAQKEEIESIIKDSIMINVIDTNRLYLDCESHYCVLYKYRVSGDFVYGVYIKEIGTVFLSNDNYNTIRLLNRMTIKGSDTVFYNYKKIQLKVDSIFAPPPMPNIEELPIDSLLNL